MTARPPPLRTPWPVRRRSAGFTLIEVLLALSIMAVLAALSWRGIDGMARAQEQTRRHADGVLALQAGLAQWRADLDAMIVWTAPGSQAPLPRSLVWDGNTLLITRSDATDAGLGARVVAWTRRPTGAWMRWQSAPVRTQGAWADAWAQAQRWGAAGSVDLDAQAVTIATAGSWQLHYFRNNAWTNAGSSASEGSAGGQTLAALPDGVRLLIDLAPGQPLSGRFTVDWLRPTLGGA